MISRRSFLGGIGAATVAGMATPDTLSAASVGPADLPDYDAAMPEAFWRVVRAAYRLSDRRVYFNTAGLGPVPAQVFETVTRLRRELQSEADTGREHFEEARAVVAAFVGAEPDEIAFTRNATESNSILAAGLALEAGDEVIFESHAHPGGSFPWLNLQKLRGIRVRIFDPTSEAPAEIVERVRALITPRTRVIQLSHVTAPTGIVFPVADIARLAREAGAWLHLDAAQSVGMIPIDLKTLECDSLATSGHKWMGATHETGFLYIRRARLPEVALSQAGGHSDGGHRLPDEFSYAPTARRFEYGTRDAAAVLGMAEACRWHLAIGPERVAAHGRNLARRAAAAPLPMPACFRTGSRRRPHRPACLQHCGGDRRLRRRRRPDTEGLGLRCRGWRGDRAQAGC